MDLDFNGGKKILDLELNTTEVKLDLVRESRSFFVANPWTPTDDGSGKVNVTSYPDSPNTKMFEVVGLLSPLELAQANATINNHSLVWFNSLGRPKVVAMLPISGGGGGGVTFLSELEDVDLADLTADCILTWNDFTGRWVAIPRSSFWTKENLKFTVNEDDHEIEIELL
jgi:hypothetical protein